MNAKHFLMVSMLFVLAGLLGGCHYGSYDGHRGYGYSNRSGSYRDGYRDGRVYERRRDDWRDRYSSDYWRRR
jgi:hypothetical protein